MTDTAESPQQTAAAYRADMGRLLDAIEKIPAERRRASLDGEWTVKEVLAHVAAWDREVAAAVDDVLAGHAVRFWGWDENVFNAEVARAARPATLEQVLDELRRAHSALGVRPKSPAGS